MLMRLVGTVIDGPPMPQVNMVDYTKALERLEGSVHGRKVHRWEPLLNPARYLLCSHMSVGAQHRFDDRLP